MDNDACAKLATWNLTDTVLAGLHATLEEVEVLPQCRAVLAQKPFPTTATERIRDFLDSVGVLRDAPRAEVLGQFEDIMQIDGGEAVLFSIAADDGACLVTSGDKRAIRALGARAECEGIRKALTGRVYCLEQLVRIAVARDGFPAVHDRIAEFRQVDGAMGHAFAEGVSEQQGMTRLAGFIADLRENTGTLLAE